MTITRYHIAAVLVTLLAASGACLALAHRVTVDFYLICVEWLFLTLLVSVGYVFWLRRAAPVCHIIFVEKRAEGYIATTEYYRTTRNGGQALAVAIGRAQVDSNIVSITYTEGRKQRFLPIRSAPAAQDAPVAPKKVCPQCHESAWYWNGQKHVCANCEALDEALPTRKK